MTTFANKFKVALENAGYSIEGEIEPYEHTDNWGPVDRVCNFVEKDGERYLATGRLTCIDLYPAEGGVRHATLFYAE
jgi:hypothetical protein